MVRNRFRPTALRKARLAADIPIEVLAARVGRCPSSLHHYEGGRVKPPTSVLLRMADVLDIDVAELFERTEIPT